MIDFFAGFRAERESRMALGVVEIERRRLGSHEADKAFMRIQHGAMHGLAVEAFRGVEFEGVVDAQHVGGADLGHHIGGDQHHDLVETFLSADLLRHDFTEPSQQDSGAARRAPHMPTPPTRPASGKSVRWRQA
jgi:hypothetical protein